MHRAARARGYGHAFMAIATRSIVLSCTVMTVAAIAGLVLPCVVMLPALAASVLAVVWMFILLVRLLRGAGVRDDDGSIRGFMRLSLVCLALLALDVVAGVLIPSQRQALIPLWP